MRTVYYIKLIVLNNQAVKVHTLSAVAGPWLLDFSDVVSAEVCKHKGEGRRETAG